MAIRISFSHLQVLISQVQDLLATLEACWNLISSHLIFLFETKHQKKMGVFLPGRKGAVEQGPQQWGAGRRYYGVDVQFLCFCGHESHTVWLSVLSMMSKIYSALFDGRI